VKGVSNDPKISYKGFKLNPNKSTKGSQNLKEMVVVGNTQPSNRPFKPFK
jgi:hypothetical protein